MSTFLNVDEVAGWLGVSSTTVRDWVFKRRIPFLKINGSVRFDRDELISWTNSQRVEPACPQATHQPRSGAALDSGHTRGGTE